MNNLLGLDNNLLQQVSVVERAGYYSATRLFLLVSLISVVSNGYFGYLFLGTWLGAFVLAILIGFIHFSVLRISLITLMSKPIVEAVNAKVVDTVAKPSKIKNLFNGTRQLTRFNIASIMRFVLVGLIAITICIPMSTIFFHNEAMQIEESHRVHVLQNYNAVSAQMHIRAGVVDRDLSQAHYPFVIFEVLWEKSGYRLLVFVFLILVYTPLFALARLRYGKDYSYGDLVRDEMRKDILIDYHETVEQSQFFLDKSFPEFKKKLTELTAFSDPPFKHCAKTLSVRKFGATADFRQYMRSI
jgi:hypothetical protein